MLLHGFAVAFAEPGLGDLRVLPDAHYDGEIVRAAGRLVARGVDVRAERRLGGFLLGRLRDSLDRRLDQFLELALGDPSRAGA